MQTDDDSVHVHMTICPFHFKYIWQYDYLILSIYDMFYSILEAYADKIHFPKESIVKLCKINLRWLDEHGHV